MNGIIFLFDNFLLTALIHFGMELDRLCVKTIKLDTNYEENEQKKQYQVKLISKRVGENMSG